MRLSKAVNSYLEELGLGSKSKQTIKAYACDLGMAVKHAHKDATNAFTEAMVTKYVASMVGLNANSRVRRIGTLRGFGEWGIRKGLWTTNPAADPKYNAKGSRSLPRPFEEKEIGRLLSLPLESELEKTLRALLYYTGLRLAPITTLLIGDISFNPMRGSEGKVTVPGSIRSVGKGSKPHLVPMDPALAPILSEYLRNNPGKSYDRLLRLNGKPISERRVQRLVKKWGQAAEVTDCTPHRFRHTYATDLLSRGVRLEVIQRLLNHTNIATTQIYARVADTSLVDAVLVRR